MAMLLWPKGSAEYADAVAARRVMHYRMHVEGELETDLSTKAAALNHLHMVRTHRTEQEATLALIVSAGKSPDPPPGWKESLPAD